MMGKKQRERMESKGAVGERERERQMSEQSLTRMQRRRDGRSVCSATAVLAETDMKAPRSPPKVTETVTITNVLSYWLIVSQKKQETIERLHCVSLEVHVLIVLLRMK